MCFFQSLNPCFGRGSFLGKPVFVGNKVRKSQKKQGIALDNQLEIMYNGYL